MLQLLQMVESTSRSRCDRGPAREPVADGPGDGPGRGRASVEIGAGPDGFAYDNERPRHAVELEPFWIDRTPVTNGAYAEFVERDRRRAADVLGARTASGGCGPRWADASARRPRPAGRSTSPGTRPTPSPAGPGSGCRPSTSGRRPRAGAEPRARQPRPARLRLRAGRRLRRRAAPTAARVQMLGDVWEWTSLGLRRPIPGSRPSPTPSTPRSSSATPTRCCAAAPGRRAAT